MMKKFLTIATIMTLALAGCSQKEVKEDIIKVGLVTDLTGIDDKSFSEITWKGVSEFADEHENVEAQYITPKDGELPTLVSAVDSLVMSGNEVIVLTGFTFEETAGQVAKLYPDVKFILVDGQPLVEGEYQKFENVVSVKFAENEAGFLAGVASALETQTGKVGYLGGIEVPAVVSYGSGFMQGVDYANKQMNTDVEMVDYVYSGTFSDFNIGQTISGGMFDKDIDIVMATAGVATQGAISEAKQRENVYIVGCDVDQYEDGATKNGSVVLTSGMKHIDVAVSDILDKWLNGSFQGGEVVLMDASNGGVGLSTSNPNLSDTTLVKLKEVEQLLREGEIQVLN